jgi:hypothetical protein
LFESLFSKSLVDKTGFWPQLAAFEVVMQSDDRPLRERHKSKAFAVPSYIDFVRCANVQSALRLHGAEPCGSLGESCMDKTRRGVPSFAVGSRTLSARRRLRRPPLSFHSDNGRLGYGKTNGE